MDDYKENAGLMSRPSSVQSSPHVAPLSNKNSRSSLRSKDGGSPLLPPIKLEKMVSKDYKRLDRQYSELLVKYNHAVVELSQIQHELVLKNNAISDQLAQISEYEKRLHGMKIEYSSTKQMLEGELQYYKETVQDYQMKFLKLNHELEYYKKLEFKDLESAVKENEKDDKYSQLCKQYKVLQSNYDLEQSSKVMLIDQIELLAKENRQLKEVLDSQSSFNDIDEDHTGSSYNYDEALNDLTYNYDTHTMNVNSDEDEDDDVSDNYHITSIEFASHSSPIKRDASYETPRVPSLIQTENFQFPPSPDPQTRSKRQSLPIDLQENFVLSPLKLANPDDGKHHARTESRPNHSRYNSHDILPIKVEFETGRRITSSRFGSLINSIQESELESLKNIDSPDVEDENPLASALSKLNGESSSKRSSILNLDSNAMSNDLTKQEITKLKFELQSLKLHNEKLLSYIGFELQKQNKNIKKLRNNQKIEYSDAKLIERSRELLIQKKRVLRSVSINTILPKNYNNGLGIISKGLLPINFEPEEDDYGFLNVDDKFNKRIFSNGLNHYYELESDGMLKKHKSTNFTHNIHDFDTSIDEDDTSLNNTEVDSTSSSFDSDVTENIGLFSQIKYLLTGSHKIKNAKKKAQESAVDDTLRYQFLTVAIGILILGVRFGHYNHNS